MNKFSLFVYIVLSHWYVKNKLWKITKFYIENKLIYDKNDNCFGVQVYVIEYFAVQQVVVIL